MFRSEPKVKLRVDRYWGIDVRTFLLGWRRAHRVRRMIERRKAM